MKEPFVEKNFSPASVAMIEIINHILAEYERQGYDLSLRQLYYQLVARGHIENSQKSYKRIGNLVNDARLAGLVDWNMITDRGRSTVTPPAWESPAQIVTAAAKQFAIDKWADQYHHVEVMVEKQALEGVLIPVCRQLGVRFSANKGYSSSSTMYWIGKRLDRAIKDGKRVVILYLGDHDPSGIDMTRDVSERLNMFAYCKVADATNVRVDRLALNYEQVEELNPPPNPAKESDARYEKYFNEFGETCWELDAIEPTRLANLVTNAVTQYRDEAQWQEAVKREEAMKLQLLDFANSYRASDDEDEQDEQ